MALIERLMGLEETKIPVHQFEAIAAEWARGQMTGAQAQAAIVLNSGMAMDSACVAEAQALVATIPTGTTTANRLDRLERLLVIEQVLLLADTLTAPYDTPQAVRARLGI